MVSIPHHLETAEPAQVEVHIAQENCPNPVPALKMKSDVGHCAKVQDLE